MDQYAQFLYPSLSVLYMSIGFSIVGAPLHQNKYRYLIFYLLMYLYSIALSFLIENFLHSTYEMISVTIGFVLVYSLLFKTRIFKSVAIFGIPYFIGMLAETFYLVILYILGFEIELLIDSFYAKLFAHLFILLFFVLCIYIKPVNFALKRISGYSSAIIFALINFVIFFLMIREVVDYVTNGRSTGLNTLLIFSFIIIITDGIALYFYIVREREIRTLRRYSSLKQEILPLIDYSIKQQHDFKNHLLALRALINNENHKGVEYIDSLTEELQANNEYLNWCSPILGALIQRKKQEAYQMNIDFITRANSPDDQFPVKDHELVSIISNLLDNAFEATSKLDMDKRKVEMSIGKNSRMFVSVKNTCLISNVKLENIFKRGYSTKNGSHGLGLHIVKSITNKYNGEIDVFPSNYGLEIIVSFDV